MFAKKTSQALKNHRFFGVGGEEGENQNTPQPKGGGEEVATSFGWRGHEMVL